MSVKSKLVAKDLGNPKGVMAFEEGSKKVHVLGTIIGIATGVKSKVMDNGDVFEQIMGQFEGVRADNGEVIESGILYLPSGIQERLAEPLKREGATDIQFGIQIGTRLAPNAAGYEYIVEQLHRPSAHDPLEAIRASIKENLALLPPDKKGAEPVGLVKGPAAAGLTDKAADEKHKEKTSAKA